VEQRKIPQGDALALAAHPERAQKEHYESLAGEYEAHYDDPCSRLYRERFIDAPLLAGVDLAGRDVLEAMCGSGQTTAALLARGARVTGLDISEAGVRAFRDRWPQCRAICASILDSGLAAESFDAVVAVGGLHHLHPHETDAIEHMHSLLKRGGMLCFMEPHAGSLPDWFRRQWYRFDPLFLPNEAAIDVDALKHRFADRFEFLEESYGGNLAFLFVINSMVFRIPPSWKKVYTPALLRLEALIGRLQTKRSSCFVACQWKKR
jgi:SAM-dependent methyltransferase